MRILILAFAVALVSCSSEPQQAIFFHNTEGDSTWINEAQITHFDFAHSGKSAAYTDSVNIYSLGFKKTLSTVGNGEPKAVVVKIWIYADTALLKDDEIILVGSIDGKENKFWEGRNIAGKINGTQKWILVEEKFSFPENTDYSHMFSSYVWNKSKKKVWVDDVQFEFNDL